MNDLELEAEAAFAAGRVIALKHLRKASQRARQRRSKYGWFNWYANRGRLSLDPTKSELRRVSWRRAH